jgi:hypothetical protein
MEWDRVLEIHDLVQTGDLVVVEEDVLRQFVIELVDEVIRLTIQINDVAEGDKRIRGLSEELTYLAERLAEELQIIDDEQEDTTP